MKGIVRWKCHGLLAIVISNAGDLNNMSVYMRTRMISRF